MTVILVAGHNRILLVFFSGRRRASFSYDEDQLTMFCSKNVEHVSMIKFKLGSHLWPVR